MSYLHLCSHEPKVSLGSFCRSQTLWLRERETMTASRPAPGTILFCTPSREVTPLCPYMQEFLRGLSNIHRIVTVSNNNIGDCPNTSGQSFACIW